MSRAAAIAALLVAALTVATFAVVIRAMYEGS